MLSCAIKTWEHSNSNACFILVYALYVRFLIIHAQPNHIQHDGEKENIRTHTHIHSNTLPFIVIHLFLFSHMLNSFLPCTFTIFFVVASFICPPVLRRATLVQMNLIPFTIVDMKCSKQPLFNAKNRRCTKHCRTNWINFH